MKALAKLSLLTVTLALGGACKPPPPTTETRTITPAPMPAPEPAPAPTPRPTFAPIPAPAPAAAAPIGMDEPFERLKAASARELGSGFSALRQKKYAWAREAFHNVVLVYPDYTLARFQELRAAALDGDFGAVPAL